MQKLSSQQFRTISILALLLGAAWIGVSARLLGGATNPGIRAPQQGFLAPVGQGIPAPHQGFLAPDFTLETLDGETITLSELRGQPILVNLWASWCPPCRQEMPAMQRMYEEFSAQGFTILAVNTTFQDNLTDTQAFVSEFGLTFPILLDRDGQVSDRYNLRALPSSFFIDRDGVIQEVVIGGPMAEALLRTRIERLLEID